MPWNNFTPIGAIALMGGAFLGKRLLAFALPLLSLFLGDLILSQVSSTYSSYLFSSSFLMVYVAFIAMVFIGIGISSRLNIGRVLGGSLLSAVVFFLISNFGAWMYFGMYPLNGAGLMECYVAGIPFFQNTLISQVVFSLILYVGLVYNFNKKPVLA